MPTADMDSLRERVAKLTPEQTAELRSLAQELKETVAELKRDVAEMGKGQEDEHLDDDERERLRERLMAMPDVELVGMLLGLHKIVEQRTRGSLRGLIERESTVLTTVLDRFAQAPTLDALAVWEEHREEEVEQLEA